MALYNQLSIESGFQKGTEIHFLLKHKMEHPIGIPSGKMITDSDEMAFVYLFEEEEGYRPIHFKQAIWPVMVDVLKSATDPILIREEERIPLVGFNDELTMLIYNIEGNNNYGEVFSEAVEKTFTEILQNGE